MLNDLPTKLEKRDLKINTSKTERFEISRKGDDKWKNCKFLGSILQTDNDIKKRKSLAITAANKLHSIFRSKLIPQRTKLKTLTTYVQSIFLYNCEIWTTSHNNIQEIDAFHRRMIRQYVLNIKWPNIIKNEEIYENMKITPWSHIIQHRRLNWFGKVARANNATPMRIALTYALENFKKPVGRPPNTWINVLTKLLKNELNLSWNEAFEAAKDQKNWQNITKSIKRNKIY